MNKATLYTIAISIVVIVIGAIMLVCGQLVNKDADRKFIGEMLNIGGGMLIFIGLTLIPIIGYCVKMSLEKSRARREQSDPNDLDYAASNNGNPNENYRVAVTNHLLQVCTIVYCKETFTNISKEWPYDL